MNEQGEKFAEIQSATANCYSHICRMSMQLVGLVVQILDVNPATDVDSSRSGPSPNVLRVLALTVPVIFDRVLLSKT